MAEPAPTASPSLPTPAPTLPNTNPSPDVPSPVVSDVQPAASSTPPATAAPAPALGPSQSPQAVNGVALAAAATAVAAAQSANSSGPAPASATAPAPRSDTPQPISHPSTPPVVNGQVPVSQVPAPPPTPGAGSLSTPSTNTSGGAAARAKEQLRWRDPMTVKYDGGQAQPGKLQPSVSSPQLKQIQPYQQQPSQPQSQLVQPQQHPTPPPQQAQAPQVPQHAPSQSQPQPLPYAHQQQQQQQQQQHLHPQHPQHPQTQQPQHHHQQQQQQHQSHSAHSAHQPPQQYIQHHQQQSHPYPHPHPHVHPQQPPPQQTLPPLHHRAQIQSQLPLQPPPPTRLPASQNSISKPVIMDPPGSRRAGVDPHVAGFPSPTIDHANVNGKFVDDCTRITFAVQQSLPESVRRIVRDNWEKCLLGSEFHQAFILNASIHHALPSITRRAVRDFGEKMVRESKSELIGHFTTADLDEVADLIISKASDNFLDKCLAKRLRTIEAKPLINALAKAERLGYEPGDIVDADQHERVIPQEAYPGAAAAAANGFAQARPVQIPQQPPPQAQPQPQMSYPPHQHLQCMSCYRTFTQVSAYDHHTRYNVCTQTPPTTTKGFEHSCPHCGQGFTRLEELQGHVESRICTTVASSKVSRGPGRPARSAPLSQANPVAILPSMSQSPGPNGYPPAYTQTQQPQATPIHHSSGPRPSMGTPTSTASPNPSDPYAHLSQESLNQMNEELQGAEMKYAPRFAEAEAIQDENERRAKIEGLRNSFGTKQSMIRKKYGVRLRERRTKAEIAAERERMGLKRAEREKAKIALANQQNNSSSPAPALGATPGTVATAATASAWTAANTPRAQNIWDDHDAKRRRLDGAGGYQTPYKSLADETPTRKTLSVTQLGGGLTAEVTAEAQDPTAPPPSAQLARGQQQQPAPMEPKRESTSASPVHSGDHMEQLRSTSDDASRRASVEAATVPPSQHNQPPAAMDIDSDSSDDDQDIPSALPANVRSSLTSSQPQLHGLST